MKVYKGNFIARLLLISHPFTKPNFSSPQIEFNNVNWKHQTIGILNKPMVSFSSWTLKMALVKHLKFHKPTHLGLIEVWILFDILDYSMLTFLNYSWFNNTFKSLATFSFFPNHQNLAKAKYVPLFLIPIFSFKSFWVPNGHPYPSPKKGIMIIINNNHSKKNSPKKGIIIKKFTLNVYIIILNKKISIPTKVQVPARKLPILSACKRSLACKRGFDLCQRPPEWGWRGPS